MKIRLLGALVGLAIGFAVPAFAQQKDTVDPQIIEQLNAQSKKYDEAFNNGDAAAVAALFTEDAVLVTDTDRFTVGRPSRNIMQSCSSNFSNYLNKRDQYSPHIIGTAGNEVWKNGEWSLALQGHDFGPIQLKGYWSSISVREGDTWKDRMLTFNAFPAPAATPSPTTTPSNQ